MLCSDCDRKHRPVHGISKTALVCGEWLGNGSVSVLNSDPLHRDQITAIICGTWSCAANHIIMFDHYYTPHIVVVCVIKRTFTSTSWSLLICGSRESPYKNQVWQHHHHTRTGFCLFCFILLLCCCCCCCCYDYYTIDRSTLRFFDYSRTRRKMYKSPGGLSGWGPGWPCPAT